MPPPTACSSEEARQHRREGLKAAIQRGEWGMGLHLKAGGSPGMTMMMVARRM